MKTNIDKRDVDYVLSGFRRQFNRAQWLFSFDVKNYRIGIVKNEPTLRIIKTLKNGRDTHDYSLNPADWVKRWYHQISWKLINFYLSLIKEQWRECQGCGEGLIKYKNIDPNDRRSVLFCCENCYNFYGWNGTIGKVTEKDWKLIRGKYYTYKVRNVLYDLKDEHKKKASVHSLYLRLNEQVPVNEIEKVLDKLEKQGKIKEMML